MLTCTTRLCVGFILSATLASSQTARFEAASVKLAVPEVRGMRCTGGPGTDDPATLKCEGFSLSLLVMMAYDLRPFQLKAPAWMETGGYEIVAKIPPGADLPQFRVMLQTLLAERFGLRIHSEKQSMTVYDLTVAKGGPKLAKTDDLAPAKPALAWRQPAGGPPRRTKARVNRKGDSTHDLASLLTDYMAQPVRDATGLTDRYDYSLTFLMDPNGQMAGALPADESDPEFGASLLYAIQQLGLQLKKTKGDIDVFVVDQANKVPSENSRDSALPFSLFTRAQTKYFDPADIAGHANG